MTTIETERLLLRDVIEADADGPYLDWLNDPAINRYLESRFAVHDREGLHAYIAAQRADPAVHFLAIVTRHDDRHVGNIKLGPLEAVHRRGDIGILLGDPGVWGRGYAAEAIGAVAEWAFAQLPVDKLTAGAYAPNVGSIKAFERAGFHVEARRRAHYRTDEGEPVDAVLLARFASGALNP